MIEAELLKPMEKSGIGTDATRATYLKPVIRGSYAVKGKKTFKPTELEMRLVKLLEVIDKRLVTPNIRRRGEK